MSAGELIKKLQEFDPELECRFSYYDSDEGKIYAYIEGMEVQSISNGRMGAAEKFAKVLVLSNQ